MGNFRNKLINFMRGRYGIDEYGKFLFFSYLVLTVLIAVADVFVNGLAILIARSLMSVLAVYTIFRMFSRNVYKRRKENESAPRCRRLYPHGRGHRRQTSRY